MGIRSQNNDNDAAYYIGAAKSDLSQVPPAFARIHADEENLDQSKQNQNFDESAGDIAEAAESLHALGFKGLDDLLNSPDTTLGEEADVDAPYGASAPSSAAEADESEEADAGTGSLSSSATATSVSGSNENAVPMSMAAGIIMAFLLMIQFANKISQEQNELSALWARAAIGISVATYPAGSKIIAGDGTTIVDANGTYDIPPGTPITMNADGSMTIGGTTYPSGSQLNLGNGSTITTPDGTEAGIPEGAIIVQNKNGSFSTYSSQTMTDENGHKIPGGLAGMWYANGVAAGLQQQKQLKAQALGDIIGCAFSGGALVVGGAGWVKNSLFSGPDAEELADAQERVNQLKLAGGSSLHAQGAGTTPMERFDSNDEDVQKRMNRIKLAIDDDFRGKKDPDPDAQDRNIAAVQHLYSTAPADYEKAVKGANKRLDALNAEKERGAQAQNTLMNFLNMASTAGQTGSRAYGESVAADASAKQAQYKANSDIGQQVFGQTDGARDKASQQAQSQHERSQQSASQMLSSLQAITASRA